MTKFLFLFIINGIIKIQQYVNKSKKVVNKRRYTVKKIATLGPAGTFSELAVKKYIKDKNIDVDIVFYSSITKAFKAIGKECELGVIPIENTLDGYVQPTLDLLSKTDFKIIDEIIIPIQFSFVGNSKNISDIERLYVQFKTQGQCCDFLEQFNSNIKIITTESNGESFDRAKNGTAHEAAIVPQHTLNGEIRFPCEIENVTDSKENETRFIVVSEKATNYSCYKGKKFKTSLIIVQTEDKPGFLADILNEFSSRNINLMFILSHPNKKMLGQYCFFIDAEGNYLENKDVKEAINSIARNNKIKILGTYENAINSKNKK